MVTGFVFAVLGSLCKCKRCVYKVWVVVVLTESVVSQGTWFRRLNCQVSRKLVTLVLSKFIWSSLCEK